MLGTQLNCPSVSGVGASSTDQTSISRRISSSHFYSSRVQFSFGFLNSRKRHCIWGGGGGREKLKSVVVISCNSSFGSFGQRSDNNDEENNYEEDDDYVEAILLMSGLSHNFLLKFFLLF